MRDPLAPGGCRRLALAVCTVAGSLGAKEKKMEEGRMNQQQLTSDDGARMQQQVPAPRATERASPHTVLRSRWFREPAAGSGLQTGPALPALCARSSAPSHQLIFLPVCLRSYHKPIPRTTPSKKKIHGPQGWLLLLTSSHGQPSPMLDQPVCHCSQNKNRQKNYLD